MADLTDVSQTLLLGLVAVVLLGWTVPLVGFLVWQGLRKRAPREE